MTVPEPPHTCDDRCTCPIHGTPLFYAPSTDDYACQDVDCQYEHGMRGMIDQAWARVGDYVKSLRLKPGPSMSPDPDEVIANIRRLIQPKTLFTSVADAPAAMLGVEGDPNMASQVRVQGSPFLPPGMGVLIDPAYLPSWVTERAERPDPLMSGEAMDLDANDAYWRPE